MVTGGNITPDTFCASPIRGLITGINSGSWTTLAPLPHKGILHAGERFLFLFSVEKRFIYR
jgi:hypothetical protein